MPTDAIVELRRVVKRHGTVTALKGIDLSIPEGEFVSIIGSSGCGKTTTLRLIAGLEQATEGEVIVAGRSMRNLKPWQSDTPLVWQNFALFPHLTVGENVAYGLRMRGIGQAERRARSERVLDTVGLSGLADRSVRALSGGQMQRVGLARALVLEPRILLLDEPLGSLDAKAGRILQTELKRLHRDLGITFVYVTHNQAEALAMSDRVVVMDGGKIQQVDRPDTLHRRPRSRLVAEFLGMNTIVEGHVLAQHGPMTVIRTADGDFPATSSDGSHPAAGSAAAFALAADAVMIVDPAGPTAPCLAGRVEALEIVGGIGWLRVRAAGGTEILVQTSRREIETLRLVEGQSVAIAWTSTAPTLLVAS